MKRPRIEWEDLGKVAAALALILIVAWVVVHKPARASGWPFDERPVLELGGLYEFDGASTYCPHDELNPRWVGHIQITQQFGRFDWGWTRGAWWAGYQHHSCFFRDDDRNSLDALGGGVRLELGR